MHRSFLSNDRRFYRSRNGVLLGVCRGLAEYFEFSPFGVRALFVLLAMFTAIFPVLIGYIVLGLVLKPAPMEIPATDEQADFWNLCHSRPEAAQERIQRRRADLDRRLQRLESIVTSPGFDLDEEFRKLKS